jgi:hypothetical protein
MLSQFLWSEQLVLMCEYFLVSRAKIAHDLLMHCAHVAMKVRPSQAGSITARIRAVVPEKNDSILEDFLLFIADTHVFIAAEEILSLVILEALVGVVCENDGRCFGTAMRASFRLVKCSQAQGTDMACAVVAGRYAMVVDSRRTDKAHIRVIIVFAFSVLSVLGQATTKDATATGLWRRL